MAADPHAGSYWYFRARCTMVALAATIAHSRRVEREYVAPRRRGDQEVARKNAGQLQIPRLFMSLLAIPRPQHRHRVPPGQAARIDAGQRGTQLRTGRPLRQIFRDALPRLHANSCTKHVRHRVAATPPHTQEASTLRRTVDPRRRTAHGSPGIRCSARRSSVRPSPRAGVGSSGALPERRVRDRRHARYITAQRRAATARCTRR